MANKTTNYGLTKPLETEFYDVNVQNQNMDIIDGELKNKYDIATIGVNIPNGANLNDYTTVGVYRSISGAVSATLLNVPYVDAGFKLVVEVGYGTNHRIQTAYCGTVNRRFTRTLVEGTWSQWTEFATAVVAIAELV